MQSKTLLLLSALCLASSALPGCGDDPASRGPSSGNPGDGDNGDGDGDGDGDTGDGDNPHEFGDGDGDGDTSSGDGDAGPMEMGGQDTDPNLPTDGSLPKGEPAPNDWTWVSMKTTLCRNGSPAGYFYRKGSEKGLLIYLNGGGACADKFFCNLNPVDVDHDLPIEFLSHGTPDLFVGVRTQRQQAPEEGIFKRSEASNPVAKWSMIYIPYCTGDIHSGSRKDVEVPNVPGKQQFTGRLNYEKMLDSFGPTFADSTQVLLTGSSAGGFGSLFNADYTIEWFKKHGDKAKVKIISDSGVPFQNAYMAACLQKRWRTYWGLDDILPKDCTDCFAADGGDIVKGYGNWLFHKKYEGQVLGGFISSVEDEIIRAFYAPGLSMTKGKPDDCTLDPTSNTIKEAVIGSAGGLFGNEYTGQMFTDGLKDVLSTVVHRPGVVGFYTIPGTPHMHIWRPRFYEKNGNDQTIAEWTKDILAGKPTEQGTLFK
ncbi:MAG: pectin acetylesterase-family hydrolase [Myxococcales bacterium]